MNKLVQGLGWVALALALGGCPPTKPVEKVPQTQAVAVEGVKFALSTARRQVNFLRLELPKKTGGGFAKMEIASATGPEKWTPARVTMVAGAARVSSATGPVVDQFSGSPTTAVDAGTVLGAVAYKDSQDLRTFALPNFGESAAEVFLRVEVPALIGAGEYVFPVGLIGADGTKVNCTLTVTVADITLPSEPRVAALATATMEEMTAAFPETFGKLPTSYLDRTDEGSAAAVAQLDALVRMAQKNGVAFFIEDMAPPVKIDEVGRVLVEWEGYDRVMAPYLDGTAFVDRTPLPVWLAPAPPRRIRDTPTQLRQYLQQCAEHFKEHGWTQTPAFMHALLVEQGATSEMRKGVMDVIEMHLDRSFTLVGTPDVASSLKSFWVVPEDDTRLPPANRLATSSTVRAWPWMCAARGLKGMVWRHAVQLEGNKNVDAMPLFVTKGGDEAEPDVTLRMAWLSAGLNDTAHFGLVEKRTDATMAGELLAGVVGRTGLALREGAGGVGYLYAGWPTENDVWEKLPGLLDVLIVANQPGTKMATDDPQLMAAKMFLTRSHRPVARISGYTFGVFPGMEGAVIDLTTEFSVENPMGSATRMDLVWPLPPGDFSSMKRNVEEQVRGTLEIPAYGQQRWGLKMTGRLDSIREAPKLSPLQMVERVNGVAKEMNALVPIYRMRVTSDAPKIDGVGTDWPNSAYFQAFGPMRVELAYENRLSLLGGKIKKVESAAEARWAFDKEFVYALIKCPQASVAGEEQRNNQWPLVNGRWWGADGVQIQMAGGGGGGVALKEGTRVVQVAIKPSGIVLMKTATMAADGTATWKEAQLAGLKYAVNLDKTGYTVEVAIPRTWFPKDHDADDATPVWRVNILRHVGAEMTSASWSGPLVGDTDVGMMGLLTGEN